jgi:hypothetical protein
LNSKQNVRWREGKEEFGRKYMHGVSQVIVITLVKNNTRKSNQRRKSTRQSLKSTDPHNLSKCERTNVKHKKGKNNNRGKQPSLVEFETWESPGAQMKRN